MGAHKGHPGAPTDRGGGGATHPHRMRSHTRWDKGECSKQGREGQQGRGGNQDSRTREPKSRGWETTRCLSAHCGKEWWARQGKEPETKPGWAEPRTTVWCNVTHPGHRASAHATCVNHEAHANRNQQGTRPTHTQPTEWGCVRGGWLGQRVDEQGTWASHKRKRSEASCGQPKDGGVGTAKTVKRPPQQPAQPQYANYWALIARKRHTLPHPPQP